MNLHNLTVIDFNLSNKQLKSFVTQTKPNSVHWAVILKDRITLLEKEHVGELKIML